MPACRLSLVLTLVLALPVRAQAPVITPDGDPSVRSDSLYRLAVDPAAYPDEPVVLLLDDGVVRYEADGTGRTTYRQVTQILDPGAVEDYAEHEFSYSPGRQRLTVNWIRVVRPDGTVVSEAPGHVQDAHLPASLTNPVYTDVKVRRYSLSGVAPGTIVDWSYTIQELQPVLPGDFSVSWSVHTGRFTRRSRLLVELPAAVTPRIAERNLDFRRKEWVVRGRRTYLWHTADVPRVNGEEFMADSNGVFMSIELSAPIDWETIGSWYAGLARDRYALDRSVRDTLRSVLKGVQTADDTIRTLQRWVAQDIRYVSIALGLGGYQPRLPAEVVAAGYGDCKDKATLFIAALRTLGFRAHPVLLNSGGSVDRSLPSISQLNHAIAVVERPGGRVYVDLTADLVPYGELPSSVQGQFGLIVYPDGTSEQVTLPEAPPGENLNETRIVGALSTDGSVTAWYEERGLGTHQSSLRSLFVGPVDSTQRADFARAIATKLFPGSEADSLEIFDGRDLNADPRVSVHIVRGLAARRMGDGRTIILTLPLTSMRGMADAASALESRGRRRFPIDAAKIIGPVVGATEIALTLPPAWSAQLPPDVTVSGKWGSYSARYRQENGILKVSRRLEGARGVHPPEDLPDLVRWLREIGQDDTPYLVIEPGPMP